MIQRVRKAAVEIDGQVVSEIGRGLLIFLGIGRGDGGDEVDWMAEKIVHLRVFEDAGGRMQHSLPEVHGEALVVSQFTLYGDVQKGRRPDFTGAAPPQEAKELYERFMERLQGQGVTVKAGVFGAKMLVQLENDGPVTLILESPWPRHEVGNRKQERP